MAGLKKARRAKAAMEKANANAKAQQYQHRAMTAAPTMNRAPTVDHSVSRFVMTTDTASGSK